MIEIGASKSVAKNRGVDSYCSNGAASPFECVGLRESAKAATERSGYSVLTWLNLVCLDAPIVAVSWQWLFARSFGIAVTPAASSALFLTAWLIYLADRFSDSLSLDPAAPASYRQRFCLRHRSAWAVALLLIGAADGFVIFTRLDARTRMIGVSVGAFAFAYLCVNQLAPAVWRRLPLKEICIGFLFAAGVVAPLPQSLTRAIASPWVLFACLCSLNCICIAVWERALDLAQDRVSIATIFPDSRRFILPAAMALCLTSGAFGARELALSAALLAALHLFRHRIQADARTALADLVLLTPLVRLLG